MRRRMVSASGLAFSVAPAPPSRGLAVDGRKDKLYANRRVLVQFTLQKEVRIVKKRHNGAERGAMEFSINRTAGASDAGMLHEKHGKKPTTGRLKLKTTRKGLSRDEYAKWAKEQSATEKDFEAAMKNRITTLEQQLEKTSNEFLRAQLEGRISQFRMLLETEEAVRAGDRTAQEMEGAEQFVLQEAALQRGPLVSQRMKWWFGDQWSRCARLLNAGLSNIGRLYGPALPILCGLTICAGMSVGIMFAGTSGLGFNLFLACVVSSAFGYGIFVVKWKNNALRIVPFIGMLVLYGINTFLWTVTGEGGYAGARKQQGKIVGTLDSRDWFIRSPAFWRGEKFEWVDLARKVPDGGGGRRRTFHEDLNSKLLTCELSLIPRREGFRELFETGRSPDSYRQELLRQVQAFLDEFTETSTMEDFRMIRNKVALLPDNHLFEIAQSQVKVRQ